MIIPLNLKEQSYEIVVEKGILNKIGSQLDLNRKVLILTDSGVPCEYSQKVKDASNSGFIFTIPQGEESKCFDNYKLILEKMVNEGFTRTDCVVAVGGGVCGDLGGFVASTYMRGIDFYNVPTTLLSQVDSSIGGKCAIDFCGVKNIVGAFYQPKRVIIDPLTLKTLDKRQVNAGLCEAIKMACTCDKSLFELIENSENLDEILEDVIVGSLKIKRDVVEKDPKEKGLRRVLNFGHTVGHAIESYAKNLLHGECVALGMLPMCAEGVRERLKALLEKYELPTSYEAPVSQLIEYIARDKKASGKSITIACVNEIGSFELKEIQVNMIENFILRGI